MLLLGSGSPRRRELLLSLGLELRVQAPEVDESTRAGESPVAYLERIVANKAAAARRLARAGEAALLVADTVVVADGCILGKPKDEADAADMLARLDGRVHEVATRFCVSALEDAREHSETVRTEVHFRSLSHAERATYAASGEGLDKAGAYAIQGGAASFVRQIRGSYTNVVGLPLAEVAIALAALGLRS